MRRVYHFLPAEWAIDDLRKRRLKISTFSDLNDPFEFLNCEFSDKGFQEAFDEIKEIYKKDGLICFSNNWSNPLLWSHYADKHKGICLGFDVSNKSESDMVEVRYIDNKKALCDEFELVVSRSPRNEEEEERIMKKLLVSKFRGWDYEDEVRIHCELGEKDSDGNYFGDFSNDIALKQVIIGVRCDNTAEDIKKYIEGYNGIEIIKARLVFETFKVVENKEID